ncbi:MAG TPA: zinc ribbon domain-containing protein [Vicinamibacterales bacterium]|nr:zinc ribbon domain-containing protein [Vicinamibacterales bacterium]
MSSETSTKVLPPTKVLPRKQVLPPKGGSHAEDQGFQATHFFVLLSLLAATVAVILARPNAPENLILVSLTIGAAGIAALCFYRMLAPLVAPHADLERQPLSERMRTDLEREKALTLRSIKELEFDRAMGKVSSQDFEDMAARLRARALGIMKQLDEGSSAYRDLIEKELARRIGKSAAPTGEVKAVVVPGVCACGVKNDSDARFCKSCGAKLRAA